MVALSGGPLGGAEYDGATWAEDEIRAIEGYLYRRCGDQAVYAGVA